MVRVSYQKNSFIWTFDGGTVRAFPFFDIHSIADDGIWSHGLFVCGKAH